MDFHLKILTIFSRSSYVSRRNRVKLINVECSSLDISLNMLILMLNHKGASVKHLSSFDLNEAKSP